VLRFFPTAPKHSKGEWAGEPVGLEPWQMFRIASVFGWKRVGTKLRRFRQAYNAVGRKNGKALALDTPIPTPDGFRTMAEIEAGDWVFAETGAPTRVKWASPVMIGRPCHEIEFSTGERVVADAEHLWLTSARGLDVRAKGPRGASVKTRSSSVKTTAMIAGTLDHKPGERNHRVAVAEPMRTPEASLPIDPYVLGVWLGDGDAKGPRITSADQDVVEQVMFAGEIVRKGAGPYAWNIGSGSRGVTAIAEDSFGTRLRALGVFRNKHVPEDYLFASFAQRMALLQGLMDTDGHVSKAGQCTFYTTSQRLMEDARVLIASLGFKPSVVSRDAKIGPKVCGTVHAVQFWAYADRPVFRLPRKVSRQKRSPIKATRAATRQIVAVRPVPSVPVKCIAVEASSRLFLCSRGFIPTHNSTESAGIGLYMLCADGEPGAECYSWLRSIKRARTYGRGRAVG
jgi:Phage Terminase/LAGLIDADG-like domain